jgi:hypothetical protein
MTRLSTSHHHHHRCISDQIQKELQLFLSSSLCQPSSDFFTSFLNSIDTSNLSSSAAASSSHSSSPSIERAKQVLSSSLEDVVLPNKPLVSDFRSVFALHTIRIRPHHDAGSVMNHIFMGDEVTVEVQLVRYFFLGQLA